MEGDKLKVNEISSRFSKYQTEINQLVKAVAEQFLNPNEVDDTEGQSKGRVDQEISKELKKRVDDLTGNNWNIIVGTKFSASIGKGKDDQYGHFKAGDLNILILESPIKRPA